MHFIDSDHPDVVAFAKEATAGATTDREKAVALFYAVRDGIRYDPYVISSEGPEMSATTSTARSCASGWGATYPGMFGADPANDAAFRPS